MSKRLFLRTFLEYLIVILLPLLLLGFFSFALVKNQAHQTVTNTLMSNEENHAQSFYQIFDEVNSIDYLFNSTNGTLLILDKVLDDVPLTYKTSQDSDLLFHMLVSTISSHNYIDSIYIRLFDYPSRLFTSESGVQMIDLFQDNELLHLQDEMASSLWSVSRFKNSTYTTKKHVVSINKLLSAKRGYITVNYSYDYLTALLDSFCIYNDQCVLIINQENELLASSGANFALQDFPNTMTPDSDGLSTIHSDQDYLIYQNTDNIYGWTYLSITPASSAYALKGQLLTILILIACASVLFAVLISYIVTKSNIRNVHEILTLLNCTPGEQPLPDLNIRTHNQYHYILQNVVKTYLNQVHLQAVSQKNEYQSRLMEAIALQAQISPHFLFNTLENINWKTIALSGGPNDASRMIRLLSFMLKYSMQLSSEMVLLQDEIENTKNYISIMSIRYPDKVNVCWEYEPEVLKIPVPKIILQPLVENAYSHGLLKRPEKGRLLIRITTPVSSGNSAHASPSIPQSSLQILIQDNGVGIPTEKMALLRQQLSAASEEIAHDLPRHIGLMNVQRRMYLKYRDNYTLSINSTPGEGTSIAMNIHNLNP